MNDSKEVKLLINARLKGGRDLDTIRKSIADLEKAIDSQADAARRGESSYEGLKAAAAALATVQEELAARGKVVRQFEDTTRAVERQTAAVEKARKKLADYQSKTADGRTDAQQEKVQALERSYQNAQARLESFQRSVSVIGAALRETGANTDQLSSVTARLADEELAAAAAQKRVNDELRNYVETVNKARAATKQLGDEQSKLARLQTGNEDDARLGREQRKLELLQQQTTQAGLLARLQTGNENDALLGRQQAAARVTQDTGLKKQADDAERAARQYNTLARASTDLRPKIVSLRDAVEAIINPAAKSRATLSGLEKEVAAIASAISASKGPIKDYSDQFRNLQAAQRAVSGQAGLIDGFRNQLAALRENRAELVAARNAVAQYAAAVRQGGDAGEQFTRPLTEAQARLRAAAAAMRDQVIAARASRDALRAAGIDSRALADAEERLTVVTRNSTQALKQLAQAGNEVGGSVGRSARGFRLFGDEGRTTLSLMQRIRGELLALAAGWIGIQGVIGGAARTLKSFNDQQAIQSGLTFAFGGDTQQVAKETEYLIGQAERLGIAYTDVAKSYTKFAAAAIKSGAPVQETRFIFEAFAETGRVLKLTPDEMKGLFNAIGQSFSKGKIQAEELRQQIGERLPGAFALAQEALKSKFPDLDKALEKGLVGAENLLIIAESVRKAAQNGLGPALKSLDAEQQRFNTSVEFFRQQVAEAGFADAYIGLLRELTGFFKSADGKAFAQGVGRSLAGIVDGLKLVIQFVRKYQDELKAVAVAVTLAFSLSLISKVTTGTIAYISAVSEAFKTSAVAATGFGRALQFVQRAFVLFQLAAIALNIVYYFAKNEDAANKFYRAFSEGSVLAISFVREQFEVLAAYLPSLMQRAFAKMGASMPPQFQALLAVINKVTTGSALPNASISSVEGEIAAIRKKGEAEREEVRRTQREREYAGGKRRPASEGGGTLNNVTASPGARTGSTTAVDEAAAKRRASLIDQVEAALNSMNAKALNKQQDSLDSLLAAAGSQYTELAKNIAEIGGAAGSGFAARFAEALKAIQAEIRQDFFDRIEKEQVALLGSLEQLEVQAGRKNKDDLQSRLDAIDDARKAFDRKLDDAATKRAANGLPTADIAAYRARADAAAEDLKLIEKQKTAREQLTRLEKQYNETIAVRDGQIAAVRAKVKAGNISDVDAANQINTINQEALPGILAAAEATRDWATAYWSIFGGDHAEFELFLQSLDASIEKTTQLKTEFTNLEKTAINGAVRAIDSGLGSMYDNLGKVLAGQQSVGEGFKSMGKAFMQFAADFLREIALMIVKQAIFNAMKGSSNSIISAIGVAGGGGAAVKHSGGLVGRDNRTRNVPQAWFANAPRYHAGGIVGLSANEVPAILQKNEEVLSTTNPRNILNGGGMPGADAQPKSSRFVLVDDRSRVAEAMASAEGEEVTMVHLRRNLPTIRQLLKG